VDFGVFLYSNGILQPDLFSFTLSSNTVPVSNFAFISLDGNHFRINNIKMYLTDTLKVTCVSGAHVETIDVLLKGRW